MMATVKLTAIQAKHLAAAQRARKDPHWRQGWTERFCLAQASEQTRVALERKGLIESYINPTTDKIGWRLTAAGIEYTAD